MLTGCFETLAGPYDGPPQVEFEQVAGRYTRSVNEGIGTVELRVNLIGPHQGSDIQINVDVAEGSTAAEGTHYSFPNGRQVTIPANSSFGTLAISVPGGTLSAGQRVALNLELAGSADGSIEGADNLDDFALTIVGV